VSSSTTALTVFITGASSGFGRLSANALAKAGHTVYASMRGTTGRNAAQVAEPAGPAQHRRLDPPERGDDIIAHAPRVGDRGIFPHPDTLVDAPAQMLGEVPVDILVDTRHASARVDDNPAHAL